MLAPLGTVKGRMRLGRRRSAAAGGRDGMTDTAPRLATSRGLPLGAWSQSSRGAPGRLRIAGPPALVEPAVQVLPESVERVGRPGLRTVIRGAGRERRRGSQRDGRASPRRRRLGGGARRPAWRRLPGPLCLRRLRGRQQRLGPPAADRHPEGSGHAKMVRTAGRHLHLEGSNPCADLGPGSSAKAKSGVPALFVPDRAPRR
jgi:hypothetical protein